MVHQSHIAALKILALVLCVSCTKSDHNDPSITESDVESVIVRWEQLWATYDLDDLDEVFLQEPGLSYFSSEKEGIIQGFDAIVEHHEGFGFANGGATPPMQLWLEDRHVFVHGAAAVVTAIWVFGDPDQSSGNQRGPVTFVVMSDAQGKSRISHAHFANYE